MSSVLVENERADLANQPHSQSVSFQHASPEPDLSGLTDFLGTQCFYREVFNPYLDTLEPEVIGDIVDDILDIYRDLKGDLNRWHDGESGDALW
jgi:Domain of unknown function (DUF5063)